MWDNHKGLPLQLGMWLGAFKSLTTNDYIRNVKREKRERTKLVTGILCLTACLFHGSYIKVGFRLCYSMWHFDCLNGGTVGKLDKIFDSILSGSSDNNIPFSDLRHILNALGFSERIKGDHFIYSKIGVAEIVNLQPLRGKAKAYQVKQVRNLILKYKLAR